MLLNFNCNRYILMWVEMFVSQGKIQAEIVWNALYLNLYLKVGLSAGTFY